MLNGVSWWVPQTLRANPNLIKNFSKKVFTKTECNRIRGLKETLRFQNAEFGGGQEASKGNLRSSQIAWLKDVQEKEVGWIYSKVGKELVEMNKLWDFHIMGFSEPFQYTIYNAEELGRYDSHIDIGEKTWFRKISVTIQLSHPDEYEGGELMIGKWTAEKQQGMMVAFPSYREHGVNPVLKGTRESLVIWVSGPAWQ